jgi:hypothetical protein
VSFFISRQRDWTQNALYVEISVGKKNAGKDILPVRYKEEGEGKNLVDPRDAVNIATKIYKRWNLDYSDELKRLRIIDGANRTVLEFSPKGISTAEHWAEKTFTTMEKCAQCSKPIGNRVPYQTDDIGNKNFCSEICCATKYRTMFGVELPSSNLKKVAKK